MSAEVRQIQLVLRAQTGDRQAYDELLRTVQRPLFRYLSHVLDHHHEAEEVLQESFLLIYRKLKWLRDPALFRPWMYRLSSRLAYKRLKGGYRRAERLEEARRVATEWSRGWSGCSRGSPGMTARSGSGSERSPRMSGSRTRTWNPAPKTL